MVTKIVLSAAYLGSSGREGVVVTDSLGSSKMRAKGAKDLHVLEFPITGWARTWPERLLRQPRLSAFGPRNINPDLPSSCRLHTPTWPVQWCGGEKRRNDPYVQKMIQCKSEGTLCEVSKRLIACEQRKDFLNRIAPEQQMWKGKLLRHSRMRSLAPPTLHAPCLLWDWT